MDESTDKGMKVFQDTRGATRLFVNVAHLEFVVLFIDSFTVVQKSWALYKALIECFVLK